MINDYTDVKECIYKDEYYSVRDNGAVMRHYRQGKKTRKDDGVWTFGVKNPKNGYMHFGNSSGHRIHIIIATAFLGPHDSKIYVVDHKDTNRCNNRVENLRWFTKLENALNNEITRQKIIYFCGSIEAFIENPKILKERLIGEPSLEWMRTVSKEEASMAYENIRRFWEEQNKNPRPFVGRKLDDNIYRKQLIKRNPKSLHTTTSSPFINKTPQHEDFSTNVKRKQPTTNLKEAITEEEFLVQSKYPSNAWQKYWKTPTKFHCCPLEINSNTITNYYNQLIIGKTYCSTIYYDSDNPSHQVIVDKAFLDNEKSILVLSYSEYSIKQYALSKIYLSNDKIIHMSMGTFFSENGARKQFVITQGLEWHGEDSIDDYC